MGKNQEKKKLGIVLIYRIVLIITVVGYYELWVLVMIYSIWCSVYMHSVLYVYEYTVCGHI